LAWKYKRTRKRYRERAVLVSKNNKIIIDPISENTKYFKANNPNFKDNNKIISLIDFKKETLLDTLKDFKWNISKASKPLGIDISALYKEIKKYKISK